MSFPNTVKTVALIAAARHCCVCHRYKGLKIEVHHIIQQANGGSNTLENAIVLCFDCHTDAGHYHDHHPRGTKFSIPELKKARDEWHKIVKEHGIQASDNTSDHLHFRHLVLRDYHAAKEIFSGDLTVFPFPNTLLIKNDMWTYINNFFKSNTRSYNVCILAYKSHASKEEIFQKYPDAVIVNKSEEDYPYFEATRTPKKEEIINLKTKLDSFSTHLLNTDVDPVKYCRSVMHLNADCGGDSPANEPYVENFIFRPIWFSFLAITNISNNTIELKELIGSSTSDSASLRNVNDKSQEVPSLFNFPKMGILAGQTVIIPTALILSPFEYESFNETTVYESEIDEESRSHTLTHLFREPERTNFDFLGKYLKPYRIKYSLDGRVYDCEMHELDLNNLYVWDRRWHMGCCPHLFFKIKNSNLLYVKELFMRTPGILSDERFYIPHDVSSVTITELEDEITYIKEISINDISKHTNIILCKDEQFEFSVTPKDLITISGYYITDAKNSMGNEKILISNRLVGAFLKANNYK